MTAEEAIRELSGVKRKGNRFILARLPLTPGDDGLPEPRRTVTSSDSGETIRSAQLPCTPFSSALTDAIGEDEHPDPLLAPYLELPSKENGLDIEGLAVSGDRLLLGLRGPVLRGWAVVLDLETGNDDGQLKLKRTDANHRRYRRHLLDLQGLGIRDLCLNGDDLFVLAGPTMDHDGPILLFLWKYALRTTSESIITGDNLTLLFPIPHTTGANRAEGITLMPDRKSLLVVYDSPGKERLREEGGVIADVFSL
jgi:hypothetical protein